MSGITMMDTQKGHGMCLCLRIFFVTKFIQFTIYMGGCHTIKISPLAGAGSVELSSCDLHIFVLIREASPEAIPNSGFCTFYSQHFQRKWVIIQIYLFRKFNRSATIIVIIFKTVPISAELFQNYPFAAYGNIICKLSGWISSCIDSCVYICVCVCVCSPQIR